MRNIHYRIVTLKTKLYSNNNKKEILLFSLFLHFIFNFPVFYLSNIIIK